jgi:hypothetical protein
MLRAVIFAAFCCLAACKGDKNKCEQASRNYAELVYWQKTNKELALLPEAEREAARKKKNSEFVNELETSVDFFTQQCVSANNDEQVDCMIKAKTGDEALKCAKLAE